MFEFYKPEGLIDKAVLKGGGQAKKKKALVNFFLIPIGNAIKVEYVLEDDTGRSYNFSTDLKSGEILVINNYVKSFTYTIRQYSNSKPGSLTLRDGTLLFSCFREE